jgi:hypothetical protein
MTVAAEFIVNPGETSLSTSALTERIAYAIGTRRTDQSNGGQPGPIPAPAAHLGGRGDS